MTQEERQQVIQALEYAQTIGPDDLFDAALAIMRRDAEPEPSPLTNQQWRALVDAMPLAKRRD